MDELTRLIEEQARDMRLGHFVSRPHVTSLDATDYDRAYFGKPLPKFKTPMSRDDPRHGTVGGYNRGCKCEPCRRASSAARIESRKRAAVNTAWNDIPHGTLNGYNNYLCKCEDCRKANADYQREYTARRRAA